MLNLNKIGRPLAKIVGGKYNGQIVSVTDQIGDPKADDKGLMKEFKRCFIDWKFVIWDHTA